MRIAIANQFWATAGGGEAYALGLARALTDLGDVELLTPHAVDWTDVGERLQTTVAGLLPRVVDFEPAALRRVSADYDLLLNATWASDLVPASRRSILVTFFPRRPPPASGVVARVASGALRRSALLARADVPLYASGFHPLETTTTTFRWTDGDAVLLRRVAPRRPSKVALAFGSDRPSSTDVVVEVNGEVAARTTIVGGSGVTTVPVTVRGRGADGVATIRIVSDVFTPHADLGIEGDHRKLGVQLLQQGSGSGGRGLVGGLVQRTGVTALAEGATWYRSYDARVVCSDFARTWMTRWWGVDSTTVHPGVAPRRAGRKEPTILSVGRFFPSARGHSKRQLDLVRAFRRLFAKGGLERWQLHLVGGCQSEDRPYLDLVRKESEGLPVRFHVDAPGRIVSELFGSASVFWHATGFGESLSVPERHEHFGIAVVEAMSAGAVPVVYDVGGPAATVRDGVDGFHFHDLDGLVAATARLAADEELRVAMSRSSRERAEDFSPDVMRRRLLAVVEDVMA